MKKMLVFQTDFTYAEGAVASMLGVVKSVDSDIECITATHQIPKYDTYSASYRLYQYIDFWPKGTIFVSVVDPGVGTTRKACVAKTKNGYYIVTPDNGTLTHIYNKWGIEEIRQIDETKNRLHRLDNGYVSIFHGRDLFGYCAAKLASGKISFDEVGPKYPLEEIVLFKLHKAQIINNSLEGTFEINDPNFGNLWTNIPLELFKDMGFKIGAHIKTTILLDDKVVYKWVLPYYDAFGKVKEKTIMIYNNELNKMALAEVVGDLCKHYNLDFRKGYKVVFEHE